MSQKKHPNRKRLSLLIILIILFGLFFLAPKHIQRYFYLNFADLHDYKRFDKLDINKGENTFHYYSPVAQSGFNIPEKFQKEKKSETFENFLDDHKTVAFLVVRNDTMLYESYFSGYKDTSVLTSFSVAKAFVSALVGIALDEGYIYSKSIHYFFLKGITKS